MYNKKTLHQNPSAQHNVPWPDLSLSLLHTPVEGKYTIMKFEPGDIYPLADSATSTLSLDYMKEKYPDIYASIEFTCKAYDQIISDTKLCGCIRGDDILHNCSSSFKVYLSKLKFRVINNLFHKEESGFSSKEKMSDRMKKRKILKLTSLYIKDSLILSNNGSGKNKA